MSKEQPINEIRVHGEQKEILIEAGRGRYKLSKIIKVPPNVDDQELQLLILTEKEALREEKKKQPQGAPSSYCPSAPHWHSGVVVRCHLWNCFPFPGLMGPGVPRKEREEKPTQEHHPIPEWVFFSRG